jgi:hypothetical protein
MRVHRCCALLAFMLSPKVMASRENAKPSVISRTRVRSRMGVDTLELG